MKNLNKILLIIAIILVFQPSISFSTDGSAGKYTVLAPLPCIESAPTTYTDSNGQTQTNPGITCDNGNGSVATEVDFKTYVQYTMNLLIALSAVVAVVMLVWGGIEYMFTSSFSSKKTGLERAQNALVGLLLVLTSYIILRTVDPRLVEIPDTLVPKITIEKWLKENVRDSFTQNLETEISEYDRNRTKLGEELTEIRRKRAELAEKEKDLAKKIASSTDPVEINKLKVELEKTMEENIQMKAVDIVKKASTIINGTLDDIAKIVLEEDNNFWYTPEDAKYWNHAELNTKDKVLEAKIKLINQRLLLMQKDHNVAREELGKIKIFDNIDLKNQRNYYTAITQLRLLDLSIKSVVMHLDEIHYSATSPSGTKILSKKDDELKSILKSEIENLDRFINATTDATLKQKMITKKAETEKALENKLP